MLIILSLISMIIIKIILFTTLLILLYPPLKGFSHRSDSHIRVESSLFQKAHQGDSSHKGFRNGKLRIKWRFLRKCYIRAAEIRFAMKCLADREIFQIEVRMLLIVQTNSGFYNVLARCYIEVLCERFLEK
jgi:hypothetical protein